VDFSRTIVVMTSNLGATEMSQFVAGGIGFSSGTPIEEKLDSIDQKIYRTALEAARKKFTPEFMNRIDKVVVFRTLSGEHLRAIVDLELDAVQSRILGLKPGRQFMLRCTDAVKEFLLEEGTDPRYGARHLKRAIERHLVFPLSNLIATGQIELGDLVRADLDREKSKLRFTRERSAPFLNPLAMRPGSGRVGSEDAMAEAAGEDGEPAAAMDAQNVC
jgi:ATP-dependent Clp protease ATP-binding subunit ClpA